MSTRLLLCGATALLCLSPAGDTPSFQARAKTTWTKTFTEKATFDLDSMLQTLDGQEVMSPEMEMSGANSREVVLVDECLAASDGRATRIRRRFDSISAGLEMSIAAMDMEDDVELALGSPLAGHVVLCDWNENDEEYAFRYEDDDDGDVSLLERLSEDTDFKWLLPDEEIEEGDSWEVDLKDGQALFAPGGLLPMELGEAPPGGDFLEAEDVAIVAMTTLAELCREIEGDLSATWKDTRREGDRRVAVIELEIEAELNADLAEEYGRVLESVGLEARPEMVYECVVELEGKGTLLWDLEAEHFLSLELECETVLELALNWVEDFGEIGVEVEVSGTNTIGAEAEQE